MFTYKYIITVFFKKANFRALFLKKGYVIINISWFSTYLMYLCGNLFLLFLYTKMLKKILLVCVFTTSLSFTLAQSGNQETSSGDIVQADIPPQIQENSASYDYINDIEFRFCNKWVESSLLTERDLVAVDAWETKQLCLVFFNRWDKPQKIYYGYWSAEISPNNGLPMCDGNLGKWDFASMIAISGDSILTIPAGKNLIKYDKLFLPVGIGSWIHHGCINFGLQKETARDSNYMFAVQSRKAAWLDFLVNGVASLKNSISLDIQKWGIFITNKKIKAITNADGTVSLSMTVINEGNIDQTIAMTGKISNFLGYQEEFVIGTQTLGAYGKLELTHTLKNMPAYKGPFTVKMNVQNTPSFNVDVSALPQEVLKGSNVVETWILFIFSWVFLGIVLVILFILVRTIKPLFTKKQGTIANGPILTPSV